MNWVPWRVELRPAQTASPQRFTFSGRLFQNAGSHALPSGLVPLVQCEIGRRRDVHRHLYVPERRSDRASERSAVRREEKGREGKDRLCSTLQPAVSGRAETERERERAQWAQDPLGTAADKMPTDRRRIKKELMECAKDEETTGVSVRSVAEGDFTSLMGKVRRSFVYVCVWVHVLH